MKKAHLQGKLTNQFTLLLTLSLPVIDMATDNSWPELPPPPTAKFNKQNLQYMLEIVVNHYATGHHRFSQ